MPDTAPPKVFISYSHKDKDALDRLKVHLSPQERAGLVDRWDDTRIQSGQDWDAEIKQAIAAANIAILIISADFLASDYIHKNELPPLLEAAEKQGLVVLAVILKPCRFKQTPSLARYQTINPPHQPWSALNEHERETLWLKVTEDIDKALARPRRTRLTPGANAKVWNVPAPNPFFTGREDILNQLHQQLTSQHRAILSGLGGIGKTQTAIAYGHRHRDDYSALFFLRADTETNLIAGFAEMAALLGLPGRDSQDQNLIVAAVQRELREKTGWLLIADNAEDLPLARRFLPADAVGGHLLLTTRDLATLSFAPPTEVLPMEADSGARLLLQRGGLLASAAPLETVLAEHLAAARELSLELGGLPLAIEQAGAYIEEMVQTPAEYLALYKKEENASKLRAWQSSTSTPEHDSVAVTFTLAFEKVAATSPAAADLLRFCAFLAPENILELILTEGAGELSEPLASAVVDDFKRAEMIRAAARFSLLYRDSEAKALSLHRQVQAVLRDRIAEKGDESWRSLAVLALVSVFPDSREFSNWPLCEALLPHALVCARSISEKRLEFTGAAALLQRVGNYLHLRARYAEVTPLYRDALGIRERLGGPEDPDTASILNDLATLHHDEGKVLEAEALGQRALSIRERMLGPEHPDTAISLNNLSSGYETQGKLGEAEQLSQRALAIRERVFGPDHPATAQALHNLGALYQEQGKLIEAEPLQQRALAIREEVLGSEHPNTASSLGNLAELYRERGFLEKAEPLMQRVLAIREKTLGPEHPDTAMSISNLGSLYDTQGKTKEAEVLKLRALAIREKVLGPDHHDTATSLNNLGGLYERKNLPGKAEPFFRRALAIWEKSLGPTHPTVAQALENLAKILIKTGRAYSAKELTARAKGIRKKHAAREWRE